jgi:phosphoglycerate dehydrogenase-like enzyme
MTAAAALSSPPRPCAALLAKPFPLGYAYDESTLELLRALVEVEDRTASPATEAAPSKAELLLSGWGVPRLDAAFFQSYPRVRAVFHAAGSVRSLMTDEAWTRGVRIATAAQVNARPVAEFAFAQIVLSLKSAFRQTRACHAERRFARQGARIPGAYGTTIGLISLGEISRQVAQRLAALEVRVMAYDPYASAERAAALGVQLVSLEEIFARADVVSCHAPLLPATRGMIRGRHFERLKDGATFINTARGAIVAESEMVEVLQRRPDLTALLDVTDPEPPLADSPLFTLPNVFLTPHISGSVDGECVRMGHFIAEEVRRYLAGEPLRGEVTRAQAELLA